MGKRPKGYRWSLPLLMVAGLLGSANKAPATEPLRWSVREAIGYALEHSPNVAVAQSKVDEKEEAKKVVFSGSLPDLTLDAGYKYLDNVPRIEFDTAVDVPVPGLPPVRIQGAQEIGASDNYLGPAVTLGAAALPRPVHSTEIAFWPAYVT